MNDIAIRVENLGKKYRIGGSQERFPTLRDRLANAFASPFRRLRSVVRGQSSAVSNETFWALKDVSFEVQRGEVVGIIGRNGAGKTTLLKILSRITEPTEGRAELYGRVGSLLEVGTGFHPELTGRENITLNGAILGMKRAEIDRKFDEIVAFAEVEKFIDTPVKHYSSGMYVRLAFAVAAHLEPEILLVDEVLAVGDAAFQKKCLGKMGDVAREGRTVLFVSHNMAAVRSLCETAVLLRQGHIERSGPVFEVVDYYLDSEASVLSQEEVVEDDDDLGYRLIRPESEIRFVCGDAIKLSFAIMCPRPCTNATAGLVVYDLLENPVVGASSKFQGVGGSGSSLHWQVHCDMGHIPLNSGHYYVSIWFGNEYRDYAKFSGVFNLHITPSDPFGWGNKVPDSWGHFFWKPRWHILSDEHGLEGLGNE